MERSVITTFLIVCLTLGFLSFFSVYLPGQLSQAKGPLMVAALEKSSSSSLSDIVDSLPSPGPTPNSLAILEEIPAEKTEKIIEEVATSKPSHPHFKTEKRSKIAKRNTTEEAKHYPLKLYEPLEETLTRQYGHGLSVTPNIKPAVEFWRNVYGRYSLNQTILHDNRYLDIVYGVLDFSGLDSNLSLSSEEKRRIRDNIEEEKKEDLQVMLLRFDSGEQPQTAGEHIVYGLFSGFDSPDRFRAAAERIRGQWGQQDRFMAGLKRSGRYLPLMEEIFVREGVPREITRLVFVESMFTLSALSKVGAAGPWQFMPDTARNYMTINAYVDERLDPLIAAEAAARFLLKNYELVQSWPLAINGYNTGILRMVKAVERLGTRDIGTIIEQFNDPGYQFASRNFYPEFLAALEVVDHHPKYFGDLQQDTFVPFDEVILPYSISLAELAVSTATDIEVLRDLNPAYLEKNFLSHNRVPKGYTIRVPHQQKMLFLAAVDQLEANSKSDRWHVVGRKETLGQIAARYRTPVPLLRQANGLTNNILKKGQVLKIPSPPTEVVLEIR